MARRQTASDAAENDNVDRGRTKEKARLVDIEDAKEIEMNSILMKREAVGVGATSLAPSFAVVAAVDRNARRRTEDKSRPMLANQHHEDEVRLSLAQQCLLRRGYNKYSC